MRQIQVKAGPGIRHTALADSAYRQPQDSAEMVFQITADLCVQTI
jgi:hypothetical protein